MENAQIIGRGSSQPGVEAVKVGAKVKYCLYARKSTESEEQQVLSIDSQIKEMLLIAERDGLEIVDIKRESHSAKAVGQREVFNEIVLYIRSGKFTGVLTWAADRLSRNAGDLGALVDLMDQKLLLEIRTFNQNFSNSPSEKFMLMILCSQAKLENDNKVENVKRGLRARCEMGLRPGVAPTGYLNEKRRDRKCQCVIDPERGKTVKQIFEKVAHDQWSGRKVFKWLKFDLKFKARSGKDLSLSNIYLMLQNPFYYGVFEYPAKSGHWYQGKHEPLISKELFEKVNEQLKRDQIVRSELKEFAFTKLMTCGLCGSGVTADEKFREQKNGNTHRYVYYGCTRSRDKNCKCGYIREEDLIEQLVKIVDKLDLSEMHMRQKFEDEVVRINKFQKNFFGAKEASVAKVSKQIDLKDYAKYVLREGTTVEKREFLTCLRSKLVLAKKAVKIEASSTAPIENSG
jgi:DNA invertase Pin-like site-specific DNA recombinase